MAPVTDQSSRPLKTKTAPTESADSDYQSEHDASMNQKEYLKKYISFGNNDDKKKKKKKKHKVGTKTVKIIDDDIDLRNMRPIKEGEFDIFLNGEDAPQIAGIVDERGPVDFSDKRRWKIMTENEEGDLTISSHIVDTERRSRNDEENTRRNKNDNADLVSKSKHFKDRHSDSSPRRGSRNDDSNLSPPRPSKNYDSDLSPPRQSKNYDSDLSPPRQSRNNNSDSSPPRQRRHNDSNLSPTRRSTKHRTSGHSTSGRNYRNRDNNDSDLSPPRKRRQNLDTDFYESKKHMKNNNSDFTASRSKEHRNRRDDSSYSRKDRERDYSDKYSSKSSRENTYFCNNSSKDRREREYVDRDRKHRSHSETHKKKKRSRWDDEADSERERAEHYRDRNNRMTKTLDGKTAGLQDAKALREETEAHKRREAEQFSKLSKIVSGVGQAPILRDKTGRRRNLEAEAAEEREKEMRQREINEKYAKWGKGLKQVEDREEKLKNDLYEMSKPFARYADDEDLDRQLREQEKEGDPMLQYIREKQIREGKRKPDPPKYEGSFAPNRFGIKPGRRWDGVDRSNGYEKKWFDAQNTKVARQEEAYKWSTADM